MLFVRSCASDTLFTYQGTVPPRGWRGTTRRPLPPVIDFALLPGIRSGYSAIEMSEGADNGDALERVTHYEMFGSLPQVWGSLALLAFKSMLASFV